MNDDERTTLILCGFTLLNWFLSLSLVILFVGGYRPIPVFGKILITIVFLGVTLQIFFLYSMGKAMKKKRKENGYL